MSEITGRRQRRVTIVDVARHAGVSTASASKVLRNAYGASESMRTRVQESMDELGYRPHGPARGMRGRTFTIGVVVSDLENPFVGLITDGLSSVVRHQSYELFVSPGGMQALSQKSVIDAMIDHRMDGLVLVAPLMTTPELEEVAAAIPLVVVGHHGSSRSFDSVAGDDVRGSHLIVDHLVELGHRRVAFVMHADGRHDETRPECHRLQGFEQAMKKHGVHDQATILDSRWSLDGGRDAAAQIEAMSLPPTAVYAGADIVALGIMSALWDRDRSVPEVFSLAGYDNSRTASLGPIRLTTIDQAGLEMGKRVGDLLLERIHGRTEAHHVVFQPHLVVRNTTARLSSQTVGRASEE